MENRDENLWRIAKKRAAFKKHLASYIIINSFLWVVWLFTLGSEEYVEMNEYNLPWPMWCTLGWGFGLAFSYYNAYMDNRENDVQKEYQKLKEREGK